MNPLDLKGKRFGKWTVLRRLSERQYGKVLWECLCDCGNIRKVPTSNLTSGNSKSCGCVVRENFAKQATKHHKRNTRLYSIWLDMKKRCYSIHRKSYKNYGGRGISVCKEWLEDFMNFYNWAINNGYKDNLSIDRINNNGNYEPDNCRWATRSVQNNNKRTCHYITIGGETHSLSDWCRKLSINERMVNMRIQRGWDEEKALTIPKTSYL